MAARYFYREIGGEVRVDSPFAPGDAKQHLWCNPGKNAFHCWKTGRGGTLVALVAELDGCSRGEAAALLGVEGAGVRRLDADLERLFAEKYAAVVPPPPDEVALPPSTFPILALADDSPNRVAAEAYVRGRRLDPADFLVCTGGKYRDRVVIPYRGPLGNVTYWNARDLTGRHEMRYWGPPRAECGVGKEDVVYALRWPPAGAAVLVTEGEFDAASLTTAGLWGAAVGGKEMGPRQVAALAPYRVCLAFDNDDPGKNALHKVGGRLLREGLPLTFVRPPVGYKDWNQLLVALGPEAITGYAAAAARPFDQWTAIRLFAGGGPT